MTVETTERVEDVLRDVVNRLKFVQAYVDSKWEDKRDVPIGIRWSKMQTDSVLRRAAAVLATAEKGTA